MDCNAFDEAALDLLYDEERLRGRAGDELRRHVDGCTRCSGALAALQRGRDAALLEPLPVPPGLEARIFAAIEQQEELQSRSWLRTLGKFLSLAGSYSMRPQAAMAALMVLMVGMSLLLLRARPAGPGAVRITEDGVPEAEADAPARAASAQIAAMPATALPEKRAAADITTQKKSDEDRASAKADAPKEARGEAVAAAAVEPSALSEGDSDPARLADATTAQAEAARPSTAPVATATAAPIDAAYAAANEDYKARRYADAARGFDIVAKGGGSNAPMAALLAARATRYSSGCGAALPRFDNLASRFVGTSVAAEATWDAANCYREVGQLDRARQLYQAMRRVAGYRDRAEKELTSLAQREADKQAVSAAKPAASKLPRKLRPQAVWPHQAPRGLLL